jgi:hypothetical protein
VKPDRPDKPHHVHPDPTPEPQPQPAEPDDPLDEDEPVPHSRSYVFYAILAALAAGVGFVVLKLIYRKV